MPLDPQLLPLVEAITNSSQAKSTHSPEGAGPFGVLVFYHSGGWVIGDLDRHDKECRAPLSVVDLSLGRCRDNERYPSRTENAEGPFLLAETMTYFTDHYFSGAPDPDARRAEPLASPILDAGKLLLDEAGAALPEHLR